MFLTNWMASMLRTRIIKSDPGSSHLTKAVNRGMSPEWRQLCGVLVNTDGWRMAYADDLVMLVSGIFPSVMSEIMDETAILRKRYGLALTI